MRIRALSVFEGIVYHPSLVDPSQPCKPRLEVDAILRPGDADQESGPLLLSVAEYSVLIGDAETSRNCVRQLDENGRIVQRMGVRYISFPTWEEAQSSD